MKKTKQLAAVLLSLVLVLALAIPAAAQIGNYSITITNTNSSHTYTAYQIFKGDISGSDTELDPYVLSNIQWGNGVNTEGLIDALRGVGGFDGLGENATAADVAELLTKAEALDTFLGVINGNPGFLGRPTGNGVTPGPEQTTCTIRLNEAGYYLVKDAVADGAVGQSVSDYIVQVLGEESMAPKSSDIPTLLKKVYDEEFAQGDQAHTYGLGYNDVADWDIGDNVPFKLIASVPDADEIAAYDTYTYTFHDTLDASLDLLQKNDEHQTTFEIYFINDLTIDPRDAEMQYLDAVKYDVTVDEDTNSFTITLDDLKTLMVTTANGEQKPATDYNHVVIFYDAVLNENAEIGLDGNENTAYLEFSNDPNGNGTGRTEDDKVIVFTYELDGTKVDGANVDTKLEGAQFVLFNGGHTRVAQIDGNGKLVEWVNLPAGYNDRNYKEIPYEAWTGLNADTNVIMTSTAEGLFGVSGLDDGTYYLMEIKAPNGYNLLEDEVKLDIAATTANGQTWAGAPETALTALNMTITVGEAEPTREGGDLTDGTVGVTVRNNAGATLPETGGMGTTLFYLIGGLLVVGAGILLVVRIRMRSHNE